MVIAAAAAAGCGGGEASSGARTLNWYVFNEPGGANEAAINTCNKQAGGKYKIVYQRLPTDANQQRELIVRRLAAKDSTVDLIGMDVIWTAEFAGAKWIAPWKGKLAKVATAGKLEGPRRTVEYQGKVWAIPFTTNTQLLWYRKDRAPKPTKDTTWDDLIDRSAKKGRAVEVQAAQYEGLTVWINSLIAGAGGQLVDENGNVKIDPKSAGEAGRIVSKLANSKAAPPSMGTNKEDQARIGFESGRSDYQVNYSFIYPSAKDTIGAKFQKNIGWARYPRTKKGEPSRPPIGGINIGVGNYSKNKPLAFAAAQCLAQIKNQIVAAEKGGLPPTSEAAYKSPKVDKALPFADLLRVSLDQGAPRPVNPAYSDISLAIQKTFNPPTKVEPDNVVQKLKDRTDKAAEGKIF